VELKSEHSPYLYITVAPHIASKEGRDLGMGLGHKRVGPNGLAGLPLYFTNLICRCSNYSDIQSTNSNCTDHTI